MPPTLNQYDDLEQILAYISGGVSLFANSLLLLFYMGIPEVRTFL